MRAKTKRLDRLPNNKNCWYCGDPPQDVDHVIPTSKGGTNDFDNLVPCCRSCNNCKRDLLLEEFREYLKERASKNSTKHTVLKVKPFDFVFFGERNGDGNGNQTTGG